MPEKEKKNVLGLIPARGGSKGVPRKNVRSLAGKPLLAWTVEAALASRSLDRVCVTTEDAEIATVARTYGARVIDRPLDLAQDRTPGLPVYQHAIATVEKAGFRPDVLVMMNPTSPCRTAEDIDAAVDQFLENGCDSQMSVCETEHPPFWTYTIENGRLVPVVLGGEAVPIRQQAPMTYRLNGAVYVMKRDVIMEQGLVMGEDTRPFIMSVEHSVDIDHEFDLKVAELVLREQGRVAR